MENMEIQVELIIKEFLTDFTDDTRLNKVIEYNKLLKSLKESEERISPNNKVYSKIGELTQHRGRVIYRIAALSSALRIHVSKDRKKETFVKSFLSECMNFPHAINAILRGLTPINGGSTIFLNAQGKQEFDDSVIHTKDEDTFADIYRFSSDYSGNIFRINMEKDWWVTIERYKFSKMKNCAGIGVNKKLLMKKQMPSTSNLDYLENWVEQGSKVVIPALKHLIISKRVESSH